MDYNIGQGFEGLMVYGGVSSLFVVLLVFGPA